MKLLTLVFAGLVLLSSCSHQPQLTQEKKLSTPTPTPTTTSSEETSPCAPENWKVAITAIDQTPLGDGTKSVAAMIGFENNDTLWGKVSGPNISGEPGKQKPVFLTTKDGLVYEFIDDTQHETKGKIETPLIPPGFTMLGMTIDGGFYYYSFVFQIPETEIPNTVTIGGMQVTCIQPYVIGENGQPIYHDKSIQLLSQMYNLNTDITEIHDAPSARRYPNLTGTEWITPDWKESIFVTDVTQRKNEIIVTYDFTNFSSHAVAPSFNGYITSNNSLFICQNDSKQRPSYELVQPGQTAQDLYWIFTIPEGETNLIFVYVHGGRVDLNDVRRINLE